MTRKQCAKCPWKVTTNPLDIPGDYTVEKHQALRGTVAAGLVNLDTVTLRVMGCHEHTPADEVACVGWLDDQLGPGNNIGLRIAAAQGRVGIDYELDGAQHECFEDTLPQD